MQAEPLGVEQAQAVADEQGQDHHQPEHVAEERDLDRRQVLGRVADGRVHGREHDGAQHHQETGTGDRREAVDAVEQGGGAHEREEGSHAAQALRASRPVNKTAAGMAAPLLAA